MTREQQEKAAFVEELSGLFSRHGLYDAKSMEYRVIGNNEVVMVRIGAVMVTVNVTADSKTAILSDVVRRISR